MQDVNILYEGSNVRLYSLKSSWSHCSDFIMSAIASQITGVSVDCLTFVKTQIKEKKQSFSSLSFVSGVHRSPVDSTHKGPVKRKMFPFDDVIMRRSATLSLTAHRLLELRASKRLIEDSYFCPHGQPCWQSSFIWHTSGLRACNVHYQNPFNCRRGYEVHKNEMTKQR